MGKLIKKGQEGIKTEWVSPQNVVHQPNGDVELYLERDLPPLPDARLRQYTEDTPSSQAKIWTPGTTPEERMDQTVQELTPRIDPFTNKLVRPSTYQPTQEQRYAGTGTERPMSWVDYAAASIPLIIPAVVSSPYWGPAAVATLTSPAFWTNVATKTIPNLIKDTALYTAADAASEATTNRDLGANINRLFDLEDNHPVGEFIGFGGTSALRRAGSKQFLNLFEKKYFGDIQDYIAKEASNSFKSVTDDVGGQSIKTWYGTKFYQNNGKIRLRLPEHTQANPQEIVLEPAGKNKFGVNQYRVHIRVPEKTGSISAAERNNLLQILYEELPDNAIIIPPESSIEEPVKRGAIAAYRWISRNPSFAVGVRGQEPVIYPGKDKFRDYIMMYPVGKRVSETKAEKMFQNAVQQGKEIVEDYLGSEAQVQQLISAEATEQQAREIAEQMRNNLKLVKEIKANPTKAQGTAQYQPNADFENQTFDATIEAATPRSAVDIEPLIESIIHEYGGHGATLAATDVNFSPKTLAWVRKIFPRISEVQAHNRALKPERLPFLKDESKMPEEVLKQLEYIEQAEEYAARTRGERMGTSSDMEGYDGGFTKESVERLRKLIWGLSPFGVLSTLSNSNQK